ncbi:hypothetical protein [Actinomadura oligospora]|uniref:hypothetical protein n=1 Tax=Actinomadura oligospora TaxID=111804 RepID=UPI0012FCD0A9|nr:hypothetical protein [Actinomadura oligospora]
MFAQFVGVAVPPIGPGLRPGLAFFPGLADGQTGREERSVVVSELEAVLVLDAVELRIGQPFLYVTAVQLRQPLCGL